MTVWTHPARIDARDQCACGAPAIHAVLLRWRALPGTIPAGADLHDVRDALNRPPFNFDARTERGQCGACAADADPQALLATLDQDALFALFRGLGAGEPDPASLTVEHRRYLPARFWSEP